MGTYVINLDEFKSIENHWTALYVSGNNKKHLMMQCILMYLELNLFQKKLKSS